MAIYVHGDENTKQRADQSMYNGQVSAAASMGFFPFRSYYLTINTAVRQRPVGRFRDCHHYSKTQDASK